ncbi:MAG: T9SS type A sorting domain-containing protein, partial [Bacteroidota bacterium]
VILGETVYEEVYSLINNGNNLFAGVYGGVYLSTDRGNSWNARNSGFGPYTSIYSFDVIGNNLFAVYGGVIFTTDNGNSWFNKSNGLAYDVYGNDTVYKATTIIISGNYIFAGTSGRGIFRAKLSDFGLSNVNENKTLLRNFVLYPNPANSTFRLKYGTETETQVQISVYDCLGNQVLSSTEQSTAGTNEKTIDCSSLSTGYYIVKMQCGGSVYTQSLVIIK